jgi:hypothetical protein
MKKQIIKLNESQLNNIIKESIKNLYEAYETVQYQHFDNDTKRYDSYVLVDNSDGSILYNYQVYPGDFWKEIMNDAINDANEQADGNRFGSYSVYGCENDEYDENTLVYSTDTNEINESRNLYSNQKGNGETQSLKSDTSLYDVRAKLSNVMKSLKNDNIDDAKKQVKRLYKLVDAMINQGF